MKKQIIIILLLTINILIFAQSFTKKYITYKSRFREEFLTKTNNPKEKGNFIPIENITTIGQPLFADETWYLGLYLGVLATEYDLHKIDKNYTYAKETLNEINNILITIDRLDSVAETYWGKSPKLNGFFIREDYTKHHTPMSQDQVWNLFYGFRLIKQFIDDENTIIHTKEITKRILNALYPVIKVKKRKNKHSWCIINPNKEIVQKKIEISISKYAFAQIATFITDTNMFLKGSKNIWAKFLNSLSRTRLYHNLLMRHKIHIYNTYGVTNLTVLSSPKKALKYSLIIEKKITKYYPKGSFAHLPLTAAILYNEDIPHDKKYYKDILKAAPMRGPNYKAKPPWNTLNILACPWQKDANGSFNGLDYMLLHNLVEIYFKK